MESIWPGCRWRSAAGSPALSLVRFLAVEDPSDTSPEAEAILLEHYRRMTPAEKLSRVLDLNRAVEDLARARIRRERPHLPGADEGCSLGPIAPVKGLAALMSDCQNQDVGREHLVSDAVREAVEDDAADGSGELPRRTGPARPDSRRFQDHAEPAVDVL